MCGGEKHEVEYLTGGCQCGSVRYAVRGAPIQTYVCHCRECQMQSASAFGISVLVAPGDIEIVKGVPKAWARPTKSGALMPCYFCADCGSRLFHGDLQGRAPVSVKGGSFDKLLTYGRPCISGPHGNLQVLLFQTTGCHFLASLIVDLDVLWEWPAGGFGAVPDVRLAGV